MRRARVGMGAVGAIVVAAVLPSCGGDGPSAPVRTLTSADVMGMPAGNATGATFSGIYVVTAASLDGCSCRSGSCATIHAVTGTLTMVVQADGMLTINADCVGGVDADGSFWCGGQSSVADGVTLGISKGTFLVSSGKPTGLEVTQEETLVATIDGVPTDCDFRGHATARLAATQ